ncbi:uncharacterized protein LOC119661273 isoform X2 [Hermetia illucens]|uniref:uncharacterized protein LOC119661273 isoform X2 n=1 Tax=Hermetia illucens TaxID=343691 RepID=UPI0018CC2EE9|nr:uncharacterized protein LOC119661273 isoform X2 [Hermetia illucens]
MTECPQDILRVRCLLCCQILECNRADTSALVYHIREYHPEVTLQSSDEFQPTSVNRPHVQPQRHRTGSNGHRFNSAEDPPFASALSELNTSMVEDQKTHKHLENEVLKKGRTPSQEERFIAPVDIPGFGTKKTHVEDETAKMNSSRKSVNKTGIGDTKETQVLYKRQYKFKEPLTSHRPGKRKLYKTSIEKWRPGKSTIVCPECGANKRPMIKSQIDKVSHSPIGAAFILTCWPFCFLPCLFPPPTKEYLHCAVCNHFLGVYDRKTEVINPNENSLQRSVGGSSSSGMNKATEQNKTL